MVNVSLNTSIKVDGTLYNIPGDFPNFKRFILNAHKKRSTLPFLNTGKIVSHGSCLIFQHDIKGNLSTEVSWTRRQLNRPSPSQ